MTKGDFARGLSAAFADPQVSARLRMMNRPGYRIGDGAGVAVGDIVEIPSAFGGWRAKDWGQVISINEDGALLRFAEKIGKVNREFFNWADLAGAYVAETDRGPRKRLVVPSVCLP